MTVIGRYLGTPIPKVQIKRGKIKLEKLNKNCKIVENYENPLVDTGYDSTPQLGFFFNFRASY